MKGEDYQEFRAFPNFAGYFNAAVMFLGDLAGQRESQSRAVSLGRVERSENVRQMFGRNTTTRIDDRNRGIAFQERNLNPNCTRTVNCLNRVQ